MILDSLDFKGWPTIYITNIWIYDTLRGSVEQ